jgi:hypothetical protein
MQGGLAHAGCFIIPVAIAIKKIDPIMIKTIVVERG